MRSWSFAARVGRMAAWGMAAGLLLPAQGARGQEDAQKRDREWVSKHLDLDLLPVAFVVPRGRLTIGGPMNLTPAGFPADTYALYPNLLYGITARTEVGVGVTGAERLGPGGEAVFYMLGVQHAVSLGSRKLPALSIGGYGFAGPHERSGGAGYVVASRLLTRRAYPGGVAAHLGLELQGFSSHDSSSTALQPFVGANYAWNRRVRFSAEFRPRMSWERAHLYSLRAVVLLTRRIGLSGGLRNNGYRSHPFIGIHLD